MATVKKLTKEEQLAQGYVYVTVPERDLFDAPHPGVRINMDSFGPGTHLVSPVIAGEIQDRLGAFIKGQMRILQPGQDRKAVELVSRFSGTPIPTHPME